MKRTNKPMPESSRDRASKRYKLMWRVGTGLPRHVLDPENPDHKWSLVAWNMQDLTYETSLKYQAYWRDKAKLFDVRIVEMGTGDPPDTVMDKL